MIDGEDAIAAEILADRVARTRSQSGRLRAEAARVAEMVAETADSVAATLERLADQRPDDVHRLQALSIDAARRAAQLRERLNGHASPPTAGR